MGFQVSVKKAAVFSQEKDPGAPLLPLLQLVRTSGERAELHREIAAAGCKCINGVGDCRMKRIAWAAQ